MGKENDVKAVALGYCLTCNQSSKGRYILVVSGTEAGGHCGSVSTMVLIPEVYEAIQPYGDVPILAAGGILQENKWLLYDYGSLEPCDQFG